MPLIECRRFNVRSGPPGGALAGAAADEKAIGAGVEQVVDERFDALGGQGLAVIGEGGD